MIKSRNASGVYDTFRGRDHSLNFFQTLVMRVDVADKHEEMLKALNEGCDNHWNMATGIFQL